VKLVKLKKRVKTSSLSTSSESRKKDLCTSSTRGCSGTKVGAKFANLMTRMREK